MRRLQTILLLGYPLALHFALLSSKTDWALWLLGAVSLVQLLTTLSMAGTGKWIAMVPAVILALCILGLLKGTLLALYLPPILISSGLLWLFASTLRQGQEPIITTIARVVFQETEPQQLHYTRRVTQLWSLFFLAMLIESVLLSMFAPLELWSLFTNILNYLLMALLFVLEFSYRRLRFPQRTPPRVLWQLLITTNWSVLLRDNR